MNLSIIEKIKIATVIDFAKVAALGFALTLLAYTGMGTVTPAYAACDDGDFDGNATPGLASTDGTAGTTEVLCGDDAAGGYDLDGFDDIGIIVTADGEADFIDGTSGTDGTTNNTVITIVDTAFDPGSDDPGLVDNNAGTGIDLVGNDNLINNGGGATIGGGTIEGSSDAIQITGSGNTINNFNNGNGGVSIASGLINGTSESDGINIEGGTVGSPNVINNGMAGTGTATIQGEEDGIDVDGGYVTINNSALGEILGNTSGVDGSGINIDDDSGGDPNVTIVNDGLISTAATNGGEAAIEIDEGSAVVNVTATDAMAPGTINVTGGADAIRLESDNITLNISDQIIDADDAGGTDGDDGVVFDDSDSDNVTITDSTITAQGDGIEFTGDSDNNTLTLEGTWVTAVTDNGIEVDDGDDNTINLNAGTARGTNIAAAGDGIYVDDGDTDTTININGGSAIGGDTGNTDADDDLLTGVDPGERVGGDGIDLEEEANINISNGGIFATGTGIAIDDGDADNDGTFGNINVGDDAGTQDAIVDALNGDGIRITGGVDDWNIDVGTDGVVRSTNGTGILIGASEGGDDNNDVIVDGLVQSDNGTGMIVFSDDCCGGGFNGNNDTTVGATGVIRGGADGFEFVGDSNGADSQNSLTINGGTIIGGENNTAGDAGVRSSSDYSLIDNNGGTIIGLGEDTNGVVFESDAELGGTPAYTDDATARIIAGNIGYLVEEGSDDENVTINGTIVSGGTGIDVAAQDCSPGDDCTITINGHVLAGSTFSVAAGADINEDGVIDATDRATGTGKAGAGVTGTDDWDVVNNGTSVVAFSGDGMLFGDNNNITNNGLIIATDDGIDVGAENTIVNSATGVIRTGNGVANGGIDATVDSNGIELGGAQNFVTNLGVINTTASDPLDTEDPLDLDNDGMVHDGPDGTVDTAAGGDGIHAEVDNQGLIQNDGSGGMGIIIAEGDGIEVLNGNLLTYLIPDGTEQRINNVNGALINAKESGIKGGNFNHVLNDGDSLINADSDELGAQGTEAGIMVGDQNTVVNAGAITSGAGDGGFIGLADGIVAGNLNGYGWGSITNSGSIDVGGNAIVIGSNNFVTNSGTAAGDINGLLISGQIGNQVSNTGTLEGGGPNSNPDGTDGAGINVTGSINNQIIGGGTVTSQAGSGGDGIRVSSSIATSIIQGDVTGDDDGIVVEGGSSATTILASSATGTTGHGIEINASATNSVNVTGDVNGGEDGVNITNSTNNAVLVTGNITGDTDANLSGDGVEISGGSNNTVTAVGAISGDPGVLITNSSNNTVSGASIAGVVEGVRIDNGNNNTVSSTVGGISGATAEGVHVDGSNNTVTSAATIIGGTTGVGIEGTGNTVTASGEIAGLTGDGVEIGGTSNTVSAGGQGILGADDGVAIVSGSLNSVTSAGAIVGATGTGVEILSSNNVVTAAEEITGGDFGIPVIGEDGVAIVGNNNLVTAGTFIGGNGGNGVLIFGGSNTVAANGGAIVGTVGSGVGITGDDNNVTSTGGIGGETVGVGIAGEDNNVSAGGAIAATNGTGVQIDGDDNNVTGATTIDGTGNGAVIAGDDNDLEASGVVTGGSLAGIDINGGDGNDVEVGGISGVTVGLRIDGDGNIVDNSGATTATTGDAILITNNSNNNIVSTAGATSTNGHGISIDGNLNNVSSSQPVSGGADGVNINGTTNIVDVIGDISGTNGDGVDITGNSNTVTATGAISGDPGIIIAGNLNSVSSASVSALEDAISITGDQNNVSTGAVTSTNDEGVDIQGSGNIITTGQITGGDDGVEIENGSNNIVTAIGGIFGNGDDGVVINNGNNNQVTATGGIVGGGAGADSHGVLIIDSSNSTVSAGSAIEGGEHGVTIVNSTGSEISAAQGIFGNTGAGVLINGGGDNTVSSPLNITGATWGVLINESDDNDVTASVINGGTTGLTIVGNTNTVTTTTAGIDGGTGNAVEVVGDDNNVSSAGDLLGDGGAFLNGNQNDLSVAGNIDVGSGDGLDIDGSQNTALITGNITSDGDSGVHLTGDQNVVTADDITGNGDEGVEIEGNQNIVTAENVVGFWDGIEVDGDGNVLNVENVTGTNGDGIQLDGNLNIANAGDVTAADIGIGVTGGNNDVSAGSVTATAGDGVLLAGDQNTADVGDVDAGEDGIDIEGSQNNVTAGNVTGNGDEGIEIDGNQNNVTALDVTGNWDGLDITGDSNNIVATSVTGNNGDGIDIDGDNNIVDPGATVNAGQDGVQFADGATGNQVDLTGTVINAGDDGIDAYDSSNTVETDENTVINAGDDGIVLGMPGLEGIPQFLIWNGYINADDDGITADADGNLTTNGNFWTIVNNGDIDADFDNNGDGTGIKLNDFNLVINNAGAEITGHDGIMVRNNNDIRNFGDIDVSNDGIVAVNENTILNESDMTINAGDHGIVAGDDNTITNTGTINADTDDNNVGAGILANDNNEITHSGAITGYQGIVVNSGNTIDSSGTIQSEEDGIQANDNNTIDVSGNITSAGGDGIQIDDSNTLTNSAVVTVNSGEYALNAGDSNTVTNSGTLQAEDTAVLIGSINTVNNSGTIQGDTTGGAGDGLVGTNSNLINNTGTIDANGGDAIRLQDGNTINSSGTIDGSEIGINVDDNNIVNITGGVVNAGTNGIQAGFNNNIDVHGSSGVNAQNHGIRLLEGSNDVDLTDNITGNLQGGDGDGTGPVGEGNGIQVEAGSDNNDIFISAATVRGRMGIHFNNGSDGNVVNNFGTIIGEEDTDDNGDTCHQCAGDVNDGFSHGILIAQGVNNDIFNSGVIQGDEDGINVNGNNNDISNFNLIQGGLSFDSGDGVSINGNSNRVFNNGPNGTIFGDDMGIRVSGDNNFIQNTSNNTIEGDDLHGIYFSSGNNLDVDNIDGRIIGQQDGIDIDSGGSVFIFNDGGDIIGTFDNGIESSSADLNVTNQSRFVSGTDIGTIIGFDYGIRSFGAGAFIDNNFMAQIIGQTDDGVYLSGAGNDVFNDGLIQGDDDGISLWNVSTGTNDIINQSNGTITGNDAGIRYGSGYGYGRTLNITNSGIIQVTGEGDLPDGFGDQDDDEVNLDLINGSGADPVAAIDTRNGSSDLTTNIVNNSNGQILGANEFEEVDEMDSEGGQIATALVQTTNRFAILGGDGVENIDNFGLIDGDIATQGGDDNLTLRTGSTFNGDADLGQDLVEVQADTDVDMDGDIDSDDTILVDEGKDTLVFAANDDDSDFIPTGRYDGDVTEAETFDVTGGWWTANGSITVDGMAVNMPMAVDADGDGDLDSDVDFNTGTMATTIHPGAGLDVGGIIEVPVDLVGVDDPDTPDVDESTMPDGIQDLDSEGEPIFELVKNSAAVLTSPVVDVRSGTLGGNGTIVTDPTARGGNGGIHVGGLLNGTAEGVLDSDTNFTPPVDENDDPIDDMIELGPNLEDDFTFDRLTDTPKYGTIAPGANIFKPGDDWVRDEGAGSQSLRIGTLTVVGNVTFDPKQTTNLTKRTFAIDDPATPDVDESDLLGVDNPDTPDVDESTIPDGIRDFTDEPGEEVITDWGGQLQIDLNDSGQGDLLNVVRSSPDPLTALVDVKVDTTGPGPVDLVTQDADGMTIADEPDGVNDFTIVDMEPVDILVAGAGGPDGVPDAVVTEAQPVNDGVVTLAGRLDIVLDGEFLDEVNQNVDPVIPSSDTGCDNAPDGTPNCPGTPNPEYSVPDGIADRDAAGLLTPTADFRTVSYVWDIVIAEGGVVGTFDELGFDGGPNDGAVIIGHDEEGEPVRVPLFKGYLQYLPDRVRIISIMDFAIVAMTPNQLAVGTALDNITQFGLNTDSFHEALAFLSQDPNKKDVLNTLGPEGFNAFNEVGISLAKHGEHHAYLRTIEAQGRTLDSSARVVMNVTDNSTVGASEDDNRATFWLAGQWSDTEIDAKNGFIGYDYETVAGYGGFDYLITDNLLLGIMAGFGNTDVEYDGRGWEGDVDSWQFGGYISWFDQDWFVNAGGGAGDMDIESARDIFYGTASVGMIDRIANADYDGDFYYFYGRGGYSIDVGNDGFKITPEAGLVYTKVKQDGFSETGAGDLNLIVNSQSIESLRGTLQLRFSKYFRSGNGGGWMPYARVGISHEFEDDLRSITAAFEGAPDELFTVFADTPRETTVIVGAGVSGQISEMFSLFLDYSGEFGGRFQEHSVTGGVRLHF